MHVPDDKVEARYFRRQVVLVVLAFAAIFVAASGGVNNPSWGELLRGIAGNVIAAVICIFVLVRNDRPERNELDKIAEAFSAKRSPHIVWTNRNLDVAESEWLELITELDTAIEPAWFLGTKLSWWTKTESYREPLYRKLLGRVRRIAQSQQQGNGADYHTYILLGDAGAISVWTALIDSAIEEVVASWPEGQRSEVRQLCRSRFFVASVPTDSVKYSAVLCGSQLSVTNYISHGGTSDCPAMSIRRSSTIWSLYLNDLRQLLRDHARSGGATHTAQNSPPPQQIPRSP